MSDYTLNRSIYPMIGKIAGAGDTQETTRVGFTFQKIEVSFKTSNSACSDSWDTTAGSDGGKGHGSHTPTHRAATLIPCLYGWAVQAPRDQASGQSSGKRQHKPFQMVLPIGGITVTLLKQACADKTIIPWIVLWQGGFNERRLKLSDVRVVRFTPHVAPGAQLSNAGSFELAASDVSTIENASTAVRH